MRIGFDFDGVLCLTPFGRLAVHAPSPVPDLPEGYAALYEAAVSANPFRLALEYARFGWRTSAPEAASVLHELADAHELHIVTGRSRAGEPLLRRWLRGHRLDEKIAGIHMAPRGLRPPQHKLATARLFGIDAHIDDDPRTAYHLAKNAVERVYLLDHAGAHGDAALPPHLTLVRSLREFAEDLTSQTRTR
jgi:hypothetical protein